MRTEHEFKGKPSVLQSDLINTVLFQNLQDPTTSFRYPS